MPVGTWERTLPVRSSKGWPEPAKWQACAFCGKPAHALAAEPGSNEGSSGTLSRNILNGAEPESHPWFTGAYSIAAHHLLCSESMSGDEDWARACWYFGYDINRAENGVFLPTVPAVACELHVPVHRGPHSGGWAFDLDLAYPEAVNKLLEGVSRSVDRGGFCATPTALTNTLDRLSRDILGKVAKGAWTLTTDGLDYLPGGNGCSGALSIPGKPRLPCPRGRRHGARHGTTQKALPRRALQVGA
ncbi:AHH domain-containing protein [Myxococcus qinghaiensis]|uniref:AHH domain-containing protein n=1 Tax=Myxococcus qinghaiensis TaxID=2906758 RepID=UPI0020A79D20|nr:AHH domain-containing protein [Myxococcus qinghaiensis]MCP3165111.1 AHH domain-containing protein [Myxococcus qinghaiensis]